MSRTQDFSSQRVVNNIEVVPGERVYQQTFLPSGERQRVYSVRAGNQVYQTNGSNRIQLQQNERAVDQERTVLNQDSNSKATIGSPEANRTQRVQVVYRKSLNREYLENNSSRKSEGIEYLDRNGERSVRSRQDYEDVLNQSRLSEQARALQRQISSFKRELSEVEKDFKERNSEIPKPERESENLIDPENRSQ